MPRDKNHHVHEFLAGDVDSYVGWEIDKDCKYGSFKLADCGRSIELNFHNAQDLAKLDTIRAHMDRFERAFKRRLQQED